MFHLTMPRGRTLLPFAAAGVGALLLTAAYAAAANPDMAGWRHLLFWAGLGLALLPAVARLLLSMNGRAVTAGLLALIGLVTYVPKLLRADGEPVFFDEKLHWYQALWMDRTGELFHDNPIVPAIGHYPGFEMLVVATHKVTGLSVWNSGVALIGIAHVALLFAVHAIAKQVTGNDRVAATAAVIYALGPGFTFTTVWWSYQSVALPMIAFALLLALRGIASPTIRWWPLAGSVALIAATGVTHHLSSLFVTVLLGILLLAHLVLGVRRPELRRPAAVLAGLVGFAVAFNIAWVTWRAYDLLNYLMPSPGSLFEQFQMLRAGQSKVTHVPFSGSGLPFVETFAGYLAPVIVTVLAAVGFWFGRAFFTGRDQYRWAFAAVWALYPVTFLGVFSGRAGSWVHRPWPFLYLGICVLAAAGVVWLIEHGPAWLAARAAVSGRHRRGRLSPTPRAVGVGVLAALSVLLVGNTATEVNDQYRFPGPWVAGADTRSSTPEIISAAQWLNGHAGPDAKILSDNNTAVNFLAYGQAHPVNQGVPLWEFTQTAGEPSPGAKAALAASSAQYMVVDERMATVIPARGYWYGKEPLAFNYTAPVPLERVRKLEMQPWAQLVYSSENFRIYQFDLPDAWVAAVADNATARP